MLHSQALFRKTCLFLSLSGSLLQALIAAIHKCKKKEFGTNNLFLWPNTDINVKPMND